MTPPLDLDALKRLCEKATAGDWIIGSQGDRIWGPMGSDGEVRLSICLAGSRSSVQDISFIAAARTAMPALITEVERLRADRLVLIEKLKEARREETP